MRLVALSKSRAGPGSVVSGDVKTSHIFVISFPSFLPSVIEAVYC